MFVGIEVALLIGKHESFCKICQKGEHAMDSRMLDILQDCYSDELSLASGNLEALESRVVTFMRELGRGLLQRMVSKQVNGYKGSSRACCCGGSMRFVGHRSKNIHTTLGWITLKRAYYHCPECGQSSFPYDQASGLGSENLSVGLAKACCLLAVDDSFDQSSRKVRVLLGEQVSEKTIERVVHQVGSVVLRWQSQELETLRKDKQIPACEGAAERLYVCADGTTVHETDGWHESKVGCVYWEDGGFRRQERYVAGFDNSKRFGWYLWQQACRRGLRQAKEVVYLGDGASWVRSIHKEHFSRATFIVDWYHAQQHIWDCAKALHGEGTDAAKKWAQHRCGLLWDGWTRKLLKDLQKRRKKHRRAKRQAIEGLYRYIKTNEQRMRYDVFRAKGYQVGSGAVEGACKHVVGKRLKQSGMIWTRAGSSATLGLRVTWLNKDWEQLWSKKPLAA